ncbi:hypothetical protein D3C81_2055360 [compost metagenome]
MAFSSRECGFGAAGHLPELREADPGAIPPYCGYQIDLPLYKCSNAGGAGGGILEPVCGMGPAGVRFDQRLVGQG